MARPVKPFPQTVDDGINQEAFVDAVESQNFLARIEHESKAEYSTRRDMLNQLTGRVQTATGISKFTTVVSLSALAYIKESKLYRESKGMKTHDGRELSGTWADYLDSLNLSVGKVDEDLSNLYLFGEDALNSMQSMGIGYRDLRQYRKLPDDAKEALIEAAKQGDKETLLDLAEELIARHTKEKQALTAQVEEYQANEAATARIIEDKNKINDKLTAELQKQETRTKTKTPDDVAKQLRNEVMSFAFEAEHAIGGKLMPAIEALLQHAALYGSDETRYIHGMLRQVELKCANIRMQFPQVDHPDDVIDLTQPLDTELPPSSTGDITADDLRNMQ